MGVALGPVCMDSLLYFALEPGHRREGDTILEVLRHVWDRLTRKQWLILYPLTLAVAGTAAFFAIYVAVGGPLTWSDFFRASFERWQFVRDTFVTDFALTPTLGIAVAAGLVLAALTAFVRAPFFRAIAAPGYPLAPAKGREFARLFLFYLFSGLIVWVLPLASLGYGALEAFLAFVVLVIAILIVFADYIIVFEDMGFLAALRRSVHLLARRWVAVLVVFIVLQLLYLGLRELFAIYYQGAGGVPIVVPVVHLVVDIFVLLIVDLLLIFLYQQARQRERV